MTAAILIIAAVIALFVALLAGARADLFLGLLGEPYLQRVLLFTLLQASLSTILSVGLAIPAARALARQTEFPGRRALLQLCALPLVMPAIVAIFGVVAVYGRFGYPAEIVDAFGGDWREWRGFHFICQDACQPRTYEASTVQRDIIY